jgi:ribosomal protein S18 acetylase RimI-like enzyme
MHNNIFKWCTDRNAISSIINFFIDNIHINYISHSEVQSLRAIDWNTWNSSLQHLLRSELEYIFLCQEGSNEVSKIAIATVGGNITALAIINITMSESRTFVVVEDFIVKSDLRSTGIGSLFYKWIESQFEKNTYIFLESGANNLSAHSFFQKHGFTICSSIFSKIIR